MRACRYAFGFAMAQEFKEQIHDVFYNDTAKLPYYKQFRQSASGAKVYDSFFHTHNDTYPRYVLKRGSG